MSLPWLSGDFKKSSQSPVTDKGQASHLDQFGRSLPPRSRSRSRSQDDRHSESSRGRGRTSRDRERRKSPLSRERGRKENKDRKQSGRHSSESSNSSSDRSVERVRPVAREDAKYLNARVFVANIISKSVTKEELIKHFEKYGNVVDLLIHHNNYAFIQYLKEDHARLAVEGEHGSTFKGWRLDVKMANEGRRGPSGARGGGRGRGSLPFEGGRGGGGRERSPLRDGMYNDPYGPEGPGRGPPPFFPGEFGMRDPFYPPDPYRRGFPDPWLPPHDDPFRREPYPDPYRDAFPPARAPLPPIECEIFVVSSQLRAYGEAIENRVKGLNIIAAVTVMPEGRTASQMLEDLSQRDGLFAVFVNAQNETHRSLTLNILHGSPQEHRNMPMNDAIALIGRSFEQYVETLREKANATGPKRASIGAPRVFLPATQEVAYLLNLLADNRALTIDELSQVIKYLEERRDKLIDAERRPLATDEAIVHLPSTSQEVEKSHMPTTEEITNKILSIFSSAGGSLQGVPPLNGASQQVQPPPPPPPPPVSTVASSASLINFDNPNVQKALDNLIQSSPVLMKNFNTKASTSEAHMSETTTNVSSSYGTLRPGGIMSSSTDHQQMGPGGGPPMMGKQKDMSGYGRPPMGGFSQQGLRPPSNQHY